MHYKSLQEVFDAFNDLKVLVIGDAMIDSYVWGKVERISPEAPVPVVQVKKKEKRLGGAANVVKNIQALGATWKGIISMIYWKKEIYPEKV
jgi:bifunctional ADP-heptose synthase (sugar kinase/adenylyltransferase)